MPRFHRSPSLRGLLTVTLSIAALLAALAAGTALRAQEEAGTPLTVGTYVPNQVAEATGVQDDLAQRMQGLQERAQSAQQQGDQQAMQQIQVEAQQIQQQVTSEFLAEVEAVLPQIAEATGVQVIATEVSYTAPGIETLDLTQDIVDAMTEE